MRRLRGNGRNALHSGRWGSDCALPCYLPAMRERAPALARRIGLFDATMIVMGGIVGSGIFVTPAIVARAAHSPGLIVGAWIIGGVAALLGAFVYAELSSARPRVGGQYA